MQTKLYVGNLNYSVTSEDLKEVFSEYGEIVEAKVIEGKGFGFVEMATQSEAEMAKKELDGSQLKGRTLKVNDARPPKSKQKRGGYRSY